MAYIDLRTKQCPFCAETIQAKAVKCRFCGEFLNTDKARALEQGLEPAADAAQAGGDSEAVLFAGKPSLWAMAPTAARGLVLVVIAALLIKLPLERLVGLNLTAAQAEQLAKIRVLGAVGLILLVSLILAMKALRLKMTYYEVTADRIEWARGILDRKVDNLDMFRVVDLKLRRSLLDCIVGVGTVVLITTDKSSPEFIFEKVRNCRKLYDVIKKASLEADRRTGVVHLQ